jgi:hypothetical protein
MDEHNPIRNKLILLCVRVGMKKMCVKCGCVLGFVCELLKAAGAKDLGNILKDQE